MIRYASISIQSGAVDTLRAAIPEVPASFEVPGEIDVPMPRLTPILNAVKEAGGKAKYQPLLRFDPEPGDIYGVYIGVVHYRYKAAEPTVDALVELAMGLPGWRYDEKTTRAFVTRPNTDPLWITDRADAALALAERIRDLPGTTRPGTPSIRPIEAGDPYYYDDPRHVPRDLTTVPSPTRPKDEPAPASTRPVTSIYDVTETELKVVEKDVADEEALTRWLNRRKRWDSRFYDLVLADVGALRFVVGRQLCALCLWSDESGTVVEIFVGGDRDASEVELDLDGSPMAVPGAEQIGFEELQRFLVEFHRTGVKPDGDWDT